MALHKIYAQRYFNIFTDQWQENYARVMCFFTLSTLAHCEATPAHTDMKQNVFDTLDSQPHVYLSLGVDRDTNPTILVLHRPITYAAPLGSGKPVAHYFFTSDI